MKMKMNHITRWKRVIKILPGVGLGSDENEFLLLFLNLICSPKLMNGKWNRFPLSTPYSNHSEHAHRCKQKFFSSLVMFYAGISWKYIARIQLRKGQCTYILRHMKVPKTFVIPNRKSLLHFLLLETSKFALP